MQPEAVGGTIEELATTIGEDEETVQQICKTMPADRLEYEILHSQARSWRDSVGGITIWTHINHHPDARCMRWAFEAEA
jgi:hypothetical protein